MYPNNQQSPAPQQQDPYNFIMQSPQKSGPSFTPSSMKARIIIVAAGAVLLITLFVIAASILGSAGKTQQQRYLEIAQKQTEIVRVSALADKKAKSLSARSFAVTTQLAITSDQKKMSDILAKLGVARRIEAAAFALRRGAVKHVDARPAIAQEPGAVVRLQAGPLANRAAAARACDAARVPCFPVAP
mgnify:CR=1 FL=1